MPDEYLYDDGNVAVDTRDHSPAPAGAEISVVLDAAGRLYGRVVATLESVGLTYHGYQVLTHLRRSAAPVRLDEVPAIVRGPGPSPTEVVDDLAREGLVRIIDGGTPGAERVVLTPLGSARADDGLAQLDIVQREFAARFDELERVGLGRLLDKVRR